MTGFGTLSTGEPVAAVRIASGTLSATVLTYGAILQELRLTGVPYSLALGFPDIAAYEGNAAYFGMIIAPVANRIGGAACTVAGAPCRFAANEGANTLHSGPTGAHGALWTPVEQSDASVTLALHQPAGQGGFPGNREIRATYALDGDTLSLTLTATTDAPTLMNPALHGYWNLDGTPTAEAHTIAIDADRYLPVTPGSLPTGAIAPVDGTPFDLRRPTALRPDTVPALDHNFCLTGARGDLRHALSLTGASGIRLDLATTEPGVQIFDAGPIDCGALRTLHRHDYGARCGIAIEPQAWPDAPHNPAFPSIDLAPGTTYRQHSTYRFTKP